ncbi:unnamed protein product [Anisakis simplex]|uniref:G_PROTEIN_RECEP_F1_2 domain-containing protein n=1 Tax=Anisakis simplex TaxID=6269 RepID=A0A0M3IZ55_ANISI|nr:unnamed protein product [Anisakis simplex]
MLFSFDQFRVSALDTIPNAVMVYSYLTHSPNYGKVVWYARMACMFNAVNMVLVVMCRKTEIRERLLLFVQKWNPFKRRVTVISVQQRAPNAQKITTFTSSN